MTKRFTEKYKRSKSYLQGNLFQRVIKQRHRGKDFTIFMVQAWIYGRTPNHILELEFESLLNDLGEDLTNAFELHYEVA